MTHLNCTVWSRRSTFTGKKPDHHHLSQVIKMNIRSCQSCGYYLYSTWYIEKMTLCHCHLSELFPIILVLSWEKHKMNSNKGASYKIHNQYSSKFSRSLKIRKAWSTWVAQSVQHLLLARRGSWDQDPPGSLLNWEYVSPSPSASSSPHALPLTLQSQINK